MRLTSDKLPAQLAKGLASIYVIGGNEPLLVEEAADAVRAAARPQGYNNREIFFAESGFDWSALAQASTSLSLFAERRLLELRLSSAKVDEKGARVLLEYAANPDPDAILLIVCGVWENAIRDSRWYQGLEKVGVAVQVWPMEAARLPAWIAARLARHRLSVPPAALELIAQRTEGNLLAARQEVEKLALLHEPGTITYDEILAAVTHNARFDIFQVVEAAIDGDPKRVDKLLRHLRAEGTEPVLLLWALTKELRVLTQAAIASQRGQPVEKIFADNRIPERRQGQYKKALARRRGGFWTRMLIRAARVDLAIKTGSAPVWEELINLFGALVGRELDRGNVVKDNNGSKMVTNNER